MDWNRFCKVVAKDFRNMWPMFGMIWVNTVANNTLRGILQVLLFLLMIGGLVFFPLYFDNRPQGYWVVIAVEAAATLFLAWLSRRRMDRMSY